MIKTHVDGPKIKEMEIVEAGTIGIAEVCLCVGVMIEKISEISEVPKEYALELITNLIKENWEHRDNVKTQEINIDAKDLKEFIKTIW